jgi:hypothetical protein
MKKLLIVSAVSLCSVFANAMVAPYYFYGSQIKLILDSSDVANKLKMNRISSIKATNDFGAYQVVAGSCSVNVSVAYLPNRTIGTAPQAPRAILSVSDATCK